MHTGLSVGELLDNPLVLNAARGEAERFWPVERELLSVIAEQVSTLVYITAKVHGAKNLPDPLQVPRPSGLPEPEPDVPVTRMSGHSPRSQSGSNVVSFSEFARMQGYGTGSDVTEDGGDD